MPYEPYQDVDLQVRYSLGRAPFARVDGSGVVGFDVWSQANAGDGWTPDQHWEVNVPAADLETALVMPDSTDPQRGAKNEAIKQLLVDNRDAMPSPVTGKDIDSIEARINANGRAASAATGADEYITETLSLEYPVPFTVKG